MSSVFANKKCDEDKFPEEIHLSQGDAAPLLVDGCIDLLLPLGCPSGLSGGKHHDHPWRCLARIKHAIMALYQL